MIIEHLDADMEDIRSKYRDWLVGPIAEATPNHKTQNIVHWSSRQGQGMRITRCNEGQNGSKRWELKNDDGEEREALAKIVQGAGKVHWPAYIVRNSNVAGASHAS